MKGIKKKILLIIGLCLLLVLNVIAVCLFLDDGSEKLPPADGSSLAISFHYEATDESGHFTLASEQFSIPMDAELFAEYSSLLTDLNLYPCDTEFEIDSVAYYQISYTSGSRENYQSVRILFNESGDYVDVMINAPRQEPSSSHMVYQVKDIETWRNELCELLQKSESYQTN